MTDGLKKIKDSSGKIRILARLDRIALGNVGDTKLIDKTISELRFFFGPGYRIYYLIEGDNIILLLNGGDKKVKKMMLNKPKTF